ncbi:MAG: hypothetical protein QOK04_1702 [Solirubrobacteraceae bacterium]|jgi:hypothetical protein|nr:hypothetical protein [Solirubrobacteraceae bacterium]
MRNFLTLVALCAVAACLSAAPAACAVSSSQSGYARSGGEPQAEVSSRATGSTSGTIPFTGLDLAFMGAVGVALIASGFGLRRLAAGSGDHKELAPVVSSERERTPVG